MTTHDAPIAGIELSQWIVSWAGNKLTGATACLNYVECLLRSGEQTLAKAKKDSDWRNQCVKRNDLLVAVLSDGFDQLREACSRVTWYINHLDGICELTRQSATEERKNVLVVLDRAEKLTIRLRILLLEMLEITSLTGKPETNTKEEQ